MELISLGLAVLTTLSKPLPSGFTWWVNLEDAQGNNLFESGFAGLDNIGPIERSHLPVGGTWRLTSSLSKTSLRKSKSRPPSMANTSSAAQACTGGFTPDLRAGSGRPAASRR